MYDVVIIGGGSMGTAAAYYRAKEGAKVLVLDKYNIPNTMGSHHGMTRMLRLNYGNGSNYVPIAKEALDLWHELEDICGRRLFKQTGCISVGPPESEFVKTSIESAVANQIPYEFMDAASLMEKWPGLKIPDHYIACFDPSAGYLFSEDCLTAYKEAAVSLGADVHENEGVISIEKNKDGTLTVLTAQGMYQAKKIIVTAGPWLKKLMPDIDLNIQTMRKTISWFEPKTEKMYDADFPCFTFDTETDGHYYGFPDFLNHGVKLGRMDNNIPCDPDTVNRTYGTYPEDENDVRSFLSKYLPEAEGKLLDGKVCMFSNTPDDDFIIDVHPKHPNIVFAGGFSGHGFKFASVIGSILSELSEHGTTTRDIDFLRLNRFKGE